MINREMIKRRLIEQEEFKRNALNQKLIQREIEAKAKKLLNIKLIKAILGPRRAGKTTLGFLLLETKDFHYVNFDDEVLSTLRSQELGNLLELLNELFGRRKIIFLDEIQNIDKWELFVNRLHRLNYNIIITGSNSKLLSKELSSHLGGRVVSIQLLPFSFREFLLAKGNKINKIHETDQEIGVVKNYLNKYIQYGSFPEVIIENFDKEVASSYYNELFSTIVERDINQRFKIKYISELKALSIMLMNYFSSRISFRKLSNELGISIHTVKKYIGYFEEAYLFLTSRKYSQKPKESELSLRKVYGIDTGIINNFKTTALRDFGRIMENLAAVELKRRNYDLFYYLTKTNREIDFVMKKGDKIESLVQVVYDEDGIPSRELKSGIEGCRELRCDKLKVITWNREDYEKISGILIEYVPLWKFLLQDVF